MPILKCKKSHFLLTIFYLIATTYIFSQSDNSYDIDEDKIDSIFSNARSRPNKEHSLLVYNISKKRLKQKFDYIDQNNLIVSMYWTGHSLDSIEKQLLIYMDKDPIHACYDNEWHRKTEFKKYMDLHKGFYAKLDCRCKEEWAKLDSNLIKVLLIMDGFDQKYRKSSDDAPWISSNKDKWIEQGHYDQYNERLLGNIFDNYGFPSYRKVGLDVYEIPFAIFLHCTPSFQEKYLPLIKQSSDKDEIPKHFFAQAQDRILMQKGLPQIYGTQLIWNRKAEVLELYTVKDMSKVDVFRKEVELKKLSSYLRANNAIIPTKKNKTQ